MFRQFLALAVFMSAAGIATVSAVAVEPSERLLPLTTKGFLSTADVDRLRADWNSTQLGQLMADPKMAPFVEDVKRQIRTKLSKTDRQLRISWEDLQDVYGGEVCVAVTQPWDFELEAKNVAAAVAKTVSEASKRGVDAAAIAEIRKKARASAETIERNKRRLSRGLVLLVDVTGHNSEARELLNKIAAQLAERGGNSKAVSIEGIEAEVHTWKSDDGATNRVLYCIHADQLVATDSLSDAQQVLSRLAGNEQPSLADLPAFEVAMGRSRSVFGDSEPHIRWFVEPFGYVEVSRAYDGGRRRRGTDFLHVLSNQGFDAVQGIGGHVAFSTSGNEVLHETFVHAPAVERSEGEGEQKEGQGKYRLAANILDFPNKPTHAPGDWVPPRLSGYLTFNWNMKSAFESIGSLVDEIAGDQVFDEVIKSIERDPNGPQIEVRKELIDHLSDRVTVISDYRKPITPKSERLLVAIELANPLAVAKTVNKAMESDPGARAQEHNGHVVWEILADTPVEVDAIEIEGFDGIFDEPALVDEPEKPLIPNSAVTVAFGQLLIATHIDYIKEILDQPGAGRLDAAADYVAVEQALLKLGLNQESFRFFTRTDEAYRPTYELMRLGKMPEAETVLGKVLNQMWEPAEEGQLREQHIDGAKMPEFTEVQKYLGPGGFYVQSDESGWSIAGCILTKPAP